MIQVLDSTMFHREVGVGVPVVYLHGNPTSSYLWRNVMPAVGGLAPDLIGMGDSGKPDVGYTFDDHARYLDAWFDAVGLTEVVLVGHDWGGALAFDWAARHPGRVKGIAFTETIVKPMSWQEFPEGGRGLFEQIKTPGAGEALILDGNAMMAGLDAEYLRAYPTRESRLPLLQWPRSMPLGGEPADVVARVERYGKWLADSHDVPKLLVVFRPGHDTMMTPEMIDWCAGNIAALEIEHRDETAGHHTPEEQPEALAAALKSWVDRHGLLG
ncbi:haloalkane dehalogenase [Lentzea sp. NBRC 105346]|uniref:haloalkane dehalogenase n=1 Tax=Lentzea sp. NBRC 105346 TaxID=3032205 RepID=UPI0024A02025|nr:haloalkane dehalogenase [Lentzea sp. NBRC 105346]GLZ35555.1 haloalkane dehalogenase [Lentzea sp. NBRC 105346]